MYQISDSVCKEHVSEEKQKKVDEQITKTYSRSASNEVSIIRSNKSL